MTNRMQQAVTNAIPILIDRVKTKTPITYGELGKEIQYNARNVGRILEPIQDYCEQQDIPPLTSIVVRAYEMKPGYHYMQRFSTYSEDIEKASLHNWNQNEIISDVKEMIKKY